MSYPHTPSPGKTDTSAEAARMIKQVTRQRVLDIITASDHWGLTASEVSARTGIPLLTARPRTTELGVIGLIKDSGRRRKNANGRNEIVWVAA